MLIKRFGVQKIVIGMAFIAGIAVGTIGLGQAIASSESSSVPKDVQIYQKNENGETYGSSLNARPQDKLPDLISAVGVDGTSGYVRASDLFGAMPKTPEEALAQQSKRKVGEIRKIPLYDVDGKTVIGEFNVVNTQVIQKPAESR